MNEFRWAVTRTWRRGPSFDFYTDDGVLQQAHVDGHGVVTWVDVPLVIVEEDRSALREKTDGNEA